MPGEFWDLSFEDTVLVIQGYQDRLNKQWEQTRFITYTIYCSSTETKDRVSMYDFMPLQGDPTPEEIEQASKRRIDRQAKEQQEFTENIRKQLAEQKM